MRKAEVVTGIVAASLVAGGAGGCGSPAKASQEDQCAVTNFLPLPSAANVTTVQDTRHGDIYPCMYLGDMGFAINTPSPLGKVINETYDKATFEMEGNLGGFALLGLVL